MEACLVFDGIDLGEHRLDWRGASLVYARFVHACRVVIPNQLRLIRLFLLATLCSVAAFARQAPIGIQTADLDRSANPCNDFYEFSNGTWRAANPIPATMDRWSRRWAAGESNKDQLRVILEEASAKRDLPKDSVALAQFHL